MTKDVLVYARVSTTDKQDIETQIHYLTEYARRNDLNILEWYKDVGVSGSKSSRPAFDRMLADIRQGKAKAILTYKLDRIGRSLPHILNLFQEFEKKDVHFISATQDINTTTPSGKMFVRMLMVLSEYERDMIIERVKDGLARAEAQGKKFGRPPGSKDKKVRRKSGYYLRWSGKQ